ETRAVCEPPESAIFVPGPKRDPRGCQVTVDEYPVPGAHLPKDVRRREMAEADRLRSRLAVRAGGRRRQRNLLVAEQAPDVLERLRVRDARQDHLRAVVRDDRW